MKRFLWNRHLYDIGAVDVETGQVMECHTEKQLAAWDHQAEFVFSDEQAEAAVEGESLYFWLDEKGKIVIDEYWVLDCGLTDAENRRKRLRLKRQQPRLRKRILEQVKIK